MAFLFQNCSVAVCKRIQCDIPSFNSKEIFNVTLQGNLLFDWYIEVCCILRSLGMAMTAQPLGLLPLCSLPQTSHDHLLLVSTAEILFNDSAFALLPGQETFVKAQVPISGVGGVL